MKPSEKARKAYAAALKCTERLKQSWMEALIAESSFRVGDKVYHIHGGRGEVVNLVVNDGLAVDVYFPMFAESSLCSPKNLTRIDAHGKPLPPRT